MPSVIRNKQISEYLDKEGIAHANLGYKFLMTGIRLILDERVVRGETMDLYKEIAAIYDTDVSTVERSIRGSIRGSYAVGTPNREFFTKACDNLIFENSESDSEKIGN